MLRKLVYRREIFLLSDRTRPGAVDPRNSGRERIFHSIGSDRTHFRSVALRGAGPECRRQTLIRSRRRTTGRTIPVSIEDRTFRSISSGVGRARRFLARRKANHLRFLPRHDALAQPSRRERTNTTDLLAGARISTSMVTWWRADRVAECRGQSAVEDLCRSLTRRKSKTTYSG